MNDFDAFYATTSGPWITSGDDVQYRLEPGPVTRLFFQQTVSKSDWLANFDFPAAPYKDMPKKWYVHRGFKRLWKSVEDEILPIILEAKRLEVYGFSQGAPLACLAHEAFTFKRGFHPRTTVFGSPRFLWIKGAADVLSRFDGVRNLQVRGDLVTHVPPEWMGYLHVGEVLRMGPSRIIPRPKYHYPSEYIAELGELACPEEGPITTATGQF